jgi:hypothetical protein
MYEMLMGSATTTWWLGYVLPIRINQKTTLPVRNSLILIGENGPNTKFAGAVSNLATMSTGQPFECV